MHQILDTEDLSSFVDLRNFASFLGNDYSLVCIKCKGKIIGSGVRLPGFVPQTASNFGQVTKHC